MNRLLVVASLAALVIGAAAAVGDDSKAPRESLGQKGQVRPAANPTPAQIAAGKQGFETVYKVLMSPRCRNCHPAGSRPLQTDAGTPHKMNVSRLSFESGLECSTCHWEKNADDFGVLGGPPGAPHWQLPPKETPMIFEGRTRAQLCRQLKSPKQTGGRDLTALHDHINNDALVLWAWKPGLGRTKPPVTHAAFAAAFKAWVVSGGACP